MVAIAQTVAGYAGTVAAQEDKAAIVSNRSKLEVLGCFTAQGMGDLRKGASPDITKGFLAGSGIEIDHILPVSIVPELASRYFNLDAMSAQETGQRARNLESANWHLPDDGTSKDCYRRRHCRPWRWRRNKGGILCCHPQISRVFKPVL